jgi:hypothetical protein
MLVKTLDLSRLQVLPTEVSFFRQVFILLASRDWRFANPFLEQRWVKWWVSAHDDIRLRMVINLRILSFNQWTLSELAKNMRFWQKDLSRTSASGLADWLPWDWAFAFVVILVGSHKVD